MSKSSASQPSTGTATKSTSGFRTPSELEPHPANQRIYGEIDLTSDFIKSIHLEGILYPVIITGNGRLIDGHRRILAAKYLGFDEVPVQVKSFSDSLLERRAILHHNKQRQKTFSQMVKEGRELEEVEKKLAKKRQGTRTDLGQALQNEKSGRTRDIVAEAIGIGSGETYRVAKNILDKAEDGHKKAKLEVEELDRGNQSIHGADRAIENYEKKIENEDQVTWKEIEQLDSHLLTYTDRVNRFFINLSSGVKENGPWYSVIRSAQNHMKDSDDFGSSYRACTDQFGKSGLRYVFLYLLEKHGHVSLEGDISESDSPDAESLTNRKPSSGLLSEMLHEEEMTLNEVAMRFGVNRHLILFWMWEEDTPAKKKHLHHSKTGKLDSLRQSQS
ncbi:ParB/RepB/Spo0J family partition protein [Haloferax gibbonsii]|uniref:ParB-like N-terminal domain-containing protein n=1 Tax=Haloferax gibbonsii TaxID=35746 RepID=A0A0K1IVI2_HALGI|nr:ParB N-terminal domain-containing protein [Haloferax gibbonsii]AKU08298.1 hypothetical protein ABY42_11365 [Haloferax gibbonsii]